MRGNKTSSLSRLEWLEVDELGDQLEEKLAIDTRFDVDSFLDRIGNPTMVAILRDEVKRIRHHQQHPSAYRLTGPTETWERGPLRIGQWIEEFQLKRMVGRGATAEVWEAHNQKLKRPVALKFPILRSTEIAHRLERESQAVARLQHPHIATIHEIRNVGSETFLVSEFIDGESLQQHLDSRLLTRRQALELLLPIVEAVAYSHSMKVIHRDLKPQNILIRKSGSPVVVDFGLARILQCGGEALTCEGDVLGTPAYMAPEQAFGSEHVDERADLYSLGVLMFQLLTERLPFEGNLQTLLHQIASQEPPTPSKLSKQVDRDLDTICLKCLEKEPGNRFPSAQELALELRRYLNGEAIHARPISSWERMGRWARQKPVEAALTGLLMACTLLLVLGATTYALAMKKVRDQEYALRVNAQLAEQKSERLRVDIEKALEESNRQKAIATAQATESQSSADLLKSIFQNTDPVMWVVNGDGVADGRPQTVRKLMEVTAHRLEHHYTGSAYRKAGLLETLGDSCRATGAYELAHRLLIQASQLRQQISETDQQNSVAPVEKLEKAIHNRLLLARLGHDRGHYQQATEDYRACLETIDELENPTRRLLKLEAETSFHLGRLLLTLRKNERARQRFNRALRNFETLDQNDLLLARACRIGLEFCDLKPGQVPKAGPLLDYFEQDSWAKRVLEKLIAVIGYQTLKDWNNAARHYRKLLPTLREKLPENNYWHLLALGDFSFVLHQAGYYDEAFKTIKVAIQHGEKIAPDHPHLVHAKHHVGRELNRAGLYPDAIGYLEDAEQVHRQQLGRQGKLNKDLWLEMIWCYIHLENHPKARELCNELNQLTSRRTAVETAWLRFLEFRCRKDPAVKKASLAEAYRLAKNLARIPENGIWCERLTRICLSAGDSKKALEYSAASVKFDQQRFFELHPRVANRRMLYGKTLLLNHKTEEAKRQFELALASRKQFLDPKNRLIEEAEVALESVDTFFSSDSVFWQWNQ